MILTCTEKDNPATQVCRSLLTLSYTPRTQHPRTLAQPGAHLPQPVRQPGLYLAQLPWAVTHVRPSSFRKESVSPRWACSISGRQTSQPGSQDTFPVTSVTERSGPWDVCGIGPSEKNIQEDTSSAGSLHPKEWQEDGFRRAGALEG